MSSTVSSVLNAASLTPDGVVRWGDAVPAGHSEVTTGVYVVAQPEDLQRAGGRPDCPLSSEALADLLGRRPELVVAQQVPSVADLADRIAGFWLPDEVILYIGLAGPRRTRPTQGELAKRVAEYYATPLGARSPHAGGWFLKCLTILDQLSVHYAYCQDPAYAEQAMLGSFAEGVSSASRAGLVDTERVMPFANLEYPPGVRKRHRISGAKEPRGSRSRKPERRPAASSTASVGEESSDRRRSGAGAPTQPLRAGDIRSGIVRIPGPTKRLLPKSKTVVRVEFRGQDLGDCRWDPRVGPDRERSGVLRIGRAAVSRLTEGEELRVEGYGDGVRLV